MMAPMLAMTHSCEFSPMIPTLWQRSRPSCGTGGVEERERMNFHPLGHSLGSHGSSGWARPKAGTGNAAQLFPTQVTGPPNPWTVNQLCVCLSNTEENHLLVGYLAGQRMRVAVM